MNSIGHFQTKRNDLPAGRPSLAARRPSSERVLEFRLEAAEPRAHVPDFVFFMLTATNCLPTSAPGDPGPSAEEAGRRTLVEIKPILRANFGKTPGSELSRGL